MYFEKYLEKFNNKKIDIYIDMDGVIADYDALGFLKAKEKDNVYLDKRPILTVIEILKNISNNKNIKLNILSCTTRVNQKEGKYIWLNKYMNFVAKENINIIAREEKNYLKASIVKKEFLKENIDKNKINIMIDDSHEVISEIIKLDLGIIPLHITSILD